MSRRSVSKAKPYLLLHCNGADTATTFTDNSPEAHSFSALGDAQIDTAQYKFNGSSLLFDGTHDNISSTDPAMDFTTNFSVDFFIRHSSVTGAQTYISYWEDADNYWSLFKVATEAIGFNLVSGSSSIVIATSAAAQVAIDTWYHIAGCKVGNEYGIYLNGAQIAHVSDADSDTFVSPTTYIGSRTADDNEVYGWMNEIRICKSNPFNAAPVAGLTDKIQVPQQPYPSWV